MPFSNDGPDGEFLRRYKLADAYAFVTDGGRKQVADALLEGVSLDPSACATALSEDLTDRIDSIMGALYTMNETAHTDEEMDNQFQNGQFWQAEGASMAKAGGPLAAIDAKCREWKSQGRARFTLRKINRWRKQAEAIGRCDDPARALDHYWGLD